MYSQLFCAPTHIGSVMHMYTNYTNFSGRNVAVKISAVVVWGSLVDSVAGILGSNHVLTTDLNNSTDLHTCR